MSAQEQHRERGELRTDHAGLVPPRQEPIVATLQGLLDSLSCC